MTFTFSKLEEDSIYLGEFICSCFYYKGIFLGQQRVDYRVSYNTFYHFYDLELFERDCGSPRKHWKEVLDFLNAEGYKYDLNDTFRWKYVVGKGNIMIPGIRIWIYPKI